MSAKQQLALHLSDADRAALEWLVRQQPGWESFGNVLRTALRELCGRTEGFPERLKINMQAQSLRKRPARKFGEPLFDELPAPQAASAVPEVPGKAEALEIQKKVAKKLKAEAKRLGVPIKGKQVKPKGAKK